MSGELHFLSRFDTPDKFSIANSEYQLAPFRFARIPAIPNRVLVVNEIGEFHFLEEGDFGRFYKKALSANEDVYRDLRSKHFLLDEYAAAFWQYSVSQYRTRKNFILGGPALHIVVVTLRCHHSCPYCQVSRQEVGGASKFDMSAEIATNVVDRILESPNRHLKVEFQGGESLLGFARIKQIVEEIRRRCLDSNHEVEFVIASTLNDLTQEQLAFCRQYRVNLSTSLDGPGWLHNKNRPRSGRDSFERTIAGIKRAREHLGHDSVSALVTLTRESLRHPEAIVDTYAELKFSSIFLRPLSQYGFALKSRERIGYATEEFLEFYDRALSHLVRLNESGIALDETYTTILLRQILTPFASGYVDLRSPTGAMLGALAYNYDGYVYASDEGRMLAENNDFSFRLGNVIQPRAELFASPTAQSILAASVAESLPGCADCAFVPYCGADPVGNHAEQGTMIGHRPTSSFCNKQTALFRRLFHHLATPDSPTMRVLLRWAFGTAVPLSASVQ